MSKTLSADDIIVMIADGSEGLYQLDPIRIMKACFLVSQRGKQAWRSLFSFKPYDYGPFDPSVYAAIETLLARKLLRKKNSPGRQYPTYELTSEGKVYAREITIAAPADSQWLKETGAYVTSKSFTNLLVEIYQAYPAYAANSVFNK